MIVESLCSNNEQIEFKKRNKSHEEVQNDGHPSDEDQKELKGYVEKETSFFHNVSHRNSTT